MSSLPELFVVIAAGDHQSAEVALDATPSLATSGLARSDEFFLAERLAQVYAGATALHAAAFSYDAGMARDLIARGADIRARDRRGAEPLHAAVIGEPDASTWDPPRQREVILCLIEAGADPNAAAAGGVTPLHRAVRNRCSVAVETLLRAGADPRLRNNSGSTASDLARLDDRTRRHGQRGGEGRATRHRRTARDRHHLRCYGLPLASGFVPTMHRATPGTRTVPSCSNALTFAMAWVRIRSRAGSSTC